MSASDPSGAAQRPEPTHEEPPVYAAPPPPAYTAPPAYAQPPANQASPAYAVAPGYPVQPQYGYPTSLPAARPPSGTVSWALGFLIFIGIPFLSGIVSGVVMASVYKSSARKGGIARENARSAANWGLTYLSVSTALLLLHIIVLIAFSNSSFAGDFFPIGIPIVLYFAVTILHIVLIIVGTVKASGGKVMRVPFAIPYIRP